MMIKNQSNVQDPFLHRARGERTRVTVELISGQKVEGVIVAFDNFSLILRTEEDHLIYKHAISSISSGARTEFPEPK